MRDFLPFLLLPGLIAVVIVLIFGLRNFVKNGDPHRSNRLMRWRVGLQLLAVIIAVGLIFLVR